MDPTVNPWQQMMTPKPTMEQAQMLGQQIGGQNPDFVMQLAQQRPELFQQQGAPDPSNAGPIVPRGTSNTSITSTKTKGPDPIQNVGLKDVIGQLNERELQSLKQQGLTVEGLQKQLGELKAAPGTSDAQLWALGIHDLFTNSDKGLEFAAGAKKDRQGTIEKLQNAINVGQQNLSENEIGLLRSQLNNAFQLENMDYKKQQDKVQNEFERQKIAIAANKKATAGALDPKKAFDIRVQMTKLEPAKQARGITGFVEALNEYERAVDKFGIDPTNSTLNTAYAKMSTRFKEAENLGALAGPDLDLLKQNVQNAGGFDAWMTAQVRGGTKGIKSAIAQTRQGADNDFQLAYGNLKGVATGVEDAAQPILDDYQSAYNRATGTAAQAASSREEKIAKLKALKGEK